jgi:hypothetical protein
MDTQADVMDVSDLTLDTEQNFDEGEYRRILDRIMRDGASVSAFNSSI